MPDVAQNNSTRLKCTPRSWKTPAKPQNIKMLLIIKAAKALEIEKCCYHRVEVCDLSIIMMTECVRLIPDTLSVSVLYFNNEKNIHLV